MNNSDQFQIPQLSEAYHKARRLYGLFSALFIAYELVGIELSNEPFTAFKITLKSPQALPWVLLALIFYFSFRTTVEWFQSDKKRREQKASKIDFWASHGIAFAALFLYCVQRVLKIQVANEFSKNSGFQISFLVAMLVFVVTNINIVIKRVKNNLRIILLIFHLVLIFSIFIQLVLLVLLNIGPFTLLLIFTSIFFAITFMVSLFAFKRDLKRS